MDFILHSMAVVLGGALGLAGAVLALALLFGFGRGFVRGFRQSFAASSMNASMARRPVNQRRRDRSDDDFDHRL